MSKRRIFLSGQVGFILTFAITLLLPLSGTVKAMPMGDETKQPTNIPGQFEESNARDEIGVLAVNANPQIDVWYGLTQKFGNIGNPQDRINILGNVSDGDGDTITLKYSLNGGGLTALALGTSNVRLVENGDFNIEIFDSNLNSGLNTVVINATDSRGGSTSVTVKVDYNRSKDWTFPYFTNWQGYSLIQDRAQIIDGKWAMEADGIRTKQIGYDRLIGIGDTSWTDYEVTVPFTLLNADTSQGGVGILLRWQGHGGSDSPTTDWTDMGAYGYYSFRKGGLTLRLGSADPGSDMVKGMGIDFSTTYYLKMRVQQGPSGMGGFYSLKIWNAASSEPSAWDLTGQDGATDRSAGSMLLVAHYVDVRFGDVKITPLNFSQTYSLTINENGNGSVLRDPAKSSYAFGDEVWLTAQPDTGWIFAGWSGSGSGKTNPIRIVMDDSKTIEANFTKEGGSNLDVMLFLPNIIR